MRNLGKQKGSAPIFAIIVLAVLVLSSMSKCGSSDKPKEAPPSPAVAQASSGLEVKFSPVDSLKLSFGTISKGMLYDDYLAMAPKSARQKLEQRPDSSLPGSTVFTETCSVDGRPYTLLIARRDAVGPYKVDSILINE